LENFKLYLIIITKKKINIYKKISIIFFTQNFLYYIILFFFLEDVLRKVGEEKVLEFEVNKCHCFSQTDIYSFQI